MPPFIYTYIHNQHQIHVMKRIAFLVIILLAGAVAYSQSSDTAVVKKTFVYKSVGKTSIYADWYTSAGKAELKPAIVWIHGGALLFGSRTDLPQEQLKLYTNAGYNVIAIDYRLAPETKLPSIIKDVTDAITWVHAEGRLLNVDTSKIFVVGHSAGAYLALMSGYFLQHPPKAIVSFYGYGSILEDWYNKPDSFALTKKMIPGQEVSKLIGDSVITSARAADRLDLYIYSRQKGSWPQLVSGHNPKTETKWFRKYCPLQNIHTGYPPVLLIHGVKDLDVPYRESVLLHRQLNLKKVHNKFITWNSYGHLFDVFEGGLSNPDVLNTFQQVLSFLGSYR